MNEPFFEVYVKYLFYYYLEDKKMIYRMQRRLLPFMNPEFYTRQDIYEFNKKAVHSLCFMVILYILEKKHIYITL